MPHPSTPTVRQRPRSCLLDALHHHLSAGHLDLAVSILPLLARRGLRPPIHSLSLLLRRCLLSCSLPLARRILLHLNLTSLKPLYPSLTFLSNHLISLFFALRLPDRARNLFDTMPQPNIFSYNAMLAGYARMGMARAARGLFDRMAVRDVVSWNTLIIALARHGSPRDAVLFYSRLRRSPLGFNAHTFSGLLTACVRLEELCLVRQVHGQVFLVGFLSNLIVSSAIVDAYSKCGCVSDAKRLFDEMKVKDVLAWTTLVYGYSKSGDLMTAHKLFDEMPERNSVSWTALIGGYVQNGYSYKALNLFRLMVGECVSPDQFTFSSSLCACASVASLKHGKQIHARIIRTGFHPNAIVLSSLIDMYSKCGDLAGGLWVFERTDFSNRDVVIWNTMMSAVGQHGHRRGTIQLFGLMIKVGTKPDGNTFVVLLSACSHSGLVEEGLECFRSMAKHGVFPEEEHYLCLVDLLGRAGHFEEAMDWIRKIPHGPSIRAWNALLGACRIHGNVELGKEVAERIMELETSSSGIYVSVSNMHAESGRWECVEKVRHLMEENEVRKERAASWID
ncbi:TPR-like protein [Dioscorea alata]|uniref:TPR-like protein n=1 Tax=Dioscorea alata TaxID=55571 RepID=A0ACB7U0N0_DIOAL|nr:TPR-like protein [Dioscorea alata]